jgi:hypothetical protein
MIMADALDPAHARDRPRAWDGSARVGDLLGSASSTIRRGAVR